MSSKSARKTARNAPATASTPVSDASPTVAIAPAVTPATTLDGSIQPATGTTSAKTTRASAGGQSRPSPSTPTTSSNACAATTNRPPTEVTTNGPRHVTSHPYRESRRTASPATYAVAAWSSSATPIISPTPAAPKAPGQATTSEVLPAAVATRPEAARTAMPSRPAVATSPTT